MEPKYLRRRRSLRDAIVLVLVVKAVATGFGQVACERLKSFGYSEQAGTQPHAALLRGIDGAWYGTTQLGGTANAGVVFRINADGTGYSVLHSFAAAPDGSKPYARLVQAADGALYGTTVFGGSNGFGTVFKLNANGTDYAVLHHFTNGSDGQLPYSALVLANDGALYGTTTAGGTDGGGGKGTVFKLSLDGTGYRQLRNYSVGTPGELIQGTDGFLYGTTLSGGTANAGTVFKLNTNGTGYTILRNLASPPADKGSHHSGLIQARDGLLYGTVFSGGTNTYGAVFRMETNGANYAVLHSFSANDFDGQNPDCRLVQGPDGTLFGTTAKGGANGCGTVFQLNCDSSGYAVLRSLGDGPADPQWPSDCLALGDDGALYGTSLFGGANNEGTIFKMAQDGTACSVLHSFSTLAGDGSRPAARLTQGPEGAFYGTTFSGGINGNGTLFKISPGGSNYSSLLSFSAADGDGQCPFGDLLPGADGAFYGTTSGGDSGVGTLFRIDPNGAGYTVLRTFSSLPDGNLPCGTLVQGPDGALYGVTAAGGENDFGTVFKVSTNGSGYTVLHSFSTNGIDGWGPVAGLVQGFDSAFYGTTADGGSSGAGTIFKLSPDGSGYTVLHTFSTNGTDGTAPFAALVPGDDGSLYGTTRFGGSSKVGTVFRINSDGTGYAVLHTFAYDGGGQEPLGDLTLTPGGMLFGTTCYGGSNDLGTVFQLATNGSCFRLLQSFSSTAGGRDPSAGMLQGSDGALYGSTDLGGDLNAGTLFRLTVAHAQTPQLLLAPALSPDGNFSLVSAYADGWPLQPGDLARFEAQASSNLLDWVTLPNSLAWSNGVLRLNHTGAAGQPIRFYRLLEH